MKMRASEKTSLEIACLKDTDPCRGDLNNEIKRSTPGLLCYAINLNISWIHINRCSLYPTYSINT